jgi:hypothetical protein
MPSILSPVSTFLQRTILEIAICMSLDSIVPHRPDSRSFRFPCQMPSQGHEIGFDSHAGR